MKRNLASNITALTLLVALGVPTLTVAQAQDKPNNQHHRYQLIDLGTLGGPQSYVNEPANSFAPILNNRGTVTGWADTSTPDPYYPSFCFNPDCFVSHAFVSHDGGLKDLGVLPGGVSSSPLWISRNGLIVGLSENGQIDPLVTGFPPEIRAVLWKHGDITDLGTLEGGYESVANAVNSDGLVVGWSANTIADPFPFVDGGASQGFGYQTRAFAYQDGVMQDLGTLGTGTNATAYVVNERGQVAGDSFTNTTPNPVTSPCGQNAPSQNPFIWEKGEGMTDIGSFGGNCGFAVAINNRGQVIGLSDLPGDQAFHAYLWDRQQHPSLRDLGTLGGSSSASIQNTDTGSVIGWANLPGDQLLHAYLWRKGAMTDLGTIGSDPCSFSYSINSTDQVVGISVRGCDFTNSGAYRAFLWETGGPMVDLNELIPHDSPLHLTNPDTINDRGEIAGSGFDANGDQHAFLLIPCDENHPGVEGCDYSLVDTGPAAQVTPVPLTQSPATTFQRNSAFRGSANGMLRPFGRLGSTIIPMGVGTRDGSAPIGKDGGYPQTSLPNKGPAAKLSPTSLRFYCRNHIMVGCLCFGLGGGRTTLTNTGGAALSITSITTTGQFFRETNACGKSLAAGKSCAISIGFHPPGIGTYSGGVSVSDNAPGSPQKASLLGIASCKPIR